MVKRKASLESVRRSLITSRVSNSAAAALAQGVLACTTAEEGRASIGRAALWREKVKVLHGTRVAMQVPLISGGVLGLEVAHLDNLFKVLLDQEGFYSYWVPRLLRRARESKLTLVMYHDCATPGNVLHPDNARKSNLVYASFLELGETLCLQEAWIPLGVLRYDTEKDISGGLSCYLKCLVKTMLGFSCMSAEGLICELHSGTKLILAINQEIVFLADEDSLKNALCAKGASGRKPCIKCKNVVSKFESTRADLDPYFVSISETDPAKFDTFTDDEVWILVDAISAMAAGPHRKKDLVELERNAGWSFLQNGILQDHALRVAVRPTLHCYDSMHVYFSKGIFTYELCLFFQALNAAGIKLASFRELIGADWEKPECNNQLKSPSGRKRLARDTWILNADNYRGLASDALLLSVFLPLFILTCVLPTGNCSNECKSMLAVIAVVRLLQSFKHGSPIDADRLLNLQQRHMRLFVRTYGADSVKPKHHWAFHIPSQLRQFGKLLDCFVLERKHAVFKQDVAPRFKRLNSFERDVLGELIVLQLGFDERTDAAHENQFIMSGSSLLDELNQRSLNLHGETSAARLVRYNRESVSRNQCRIFPEEHVALVVESVICNNNRYYVLGMLWNLTSESEGFAVSMWSKDRDDMCLISLDVVLVPWIVVKMRICFFALLHA